MQMIVITRKDDDECGSVRLDTIVRYNRRRPMPEWPSLSKVANFESSTPFLWEIQKIIVNRKKNCISQLNCRKFKCSIKNLKKLMLPEIVQLEQGGSTLHLSLDECRRSNFVIAAWLVMITERLRNHRPKS